MGDGCGLLRSGAARCGEMKILSGRGDADPHLLMHELHRLDEMHHMHVG
jgi:hypothetical protein